MRNSLLCILAAMCLAAVHPSFGAAVPKAREELFPLTQVRLTGGPLKAQQEQNRKYLLRLGPDRLLSRFRSEAGLEPKAKPYGGWEAPDHKLDLAGHILGFYMSGAAMTVEATGDEELKRRLLYIVDELETVQNAHGDGYALAAKDGRSVFDEIASGKIDVKKNPKTEYCSVINGRFEPIYTMNKVLIGLWRIYVATGSEKSKRVFLRLSDWFGNAIVEKLDDAQLQKVLDCEHGSLPETFAVAFEMTGDEKYKRWARRLCHERMLAPLADGNAAYLDFHHANNEIPKYTGFERVYRITGDERLHRAMVNANHAFIHDHSWANGGNSYHEHLFPKAEFEEKLFMDGGPESCNSVNMLRQAEALFQTEPSADKMDYYERVLFDHLLSTHDPILGRTIYWTPVKPGASRTYSDEFDSMWCCTGTGFEAPGKYAQMIYTHSATASAVSVNLFAPSTLDWKERGVKLRQETAFPYGETSCVKVDAVGSDATFTIKVRRPSWAGDGFSVYVNGRAVAPRPPSDYLPITRTWKAGDRIDIEFPMSLRAELLPGSKKYVAFFYGPTLLVGDLGSEGLKQSDYFASPPSSRTSSWKLGKPLPMPRVPASAATDPASCLERAAGGPILFRLKGTDILLKPIYDLHFSRYTMYWQLVDPMEVERPVEGHAPRLTPVDLNPIDMRWTFGAHEPYTMYRRLGKKSTGGIDGNARWLKAWMDWFDAESPALMEELGLNWLHCRFYKGMGWEVEKKEFPKVKKFVENCHRHGVRALAYVQFATIYPETLGREIHDIGDWEQIDENGRKRTYFTSYFRSLPCVTCDEWVEYLKKICTIALTEGGFDGIMFDNSWAMPCYCARCERLFREHLVKIPCPAERFGFDDLSGVVQPRVNPEKLPGEIRDPVVQEWIRWRKETFEGVFARLRAHIKAVKPDAVIGAATQPFRRDDAQATWSSNTERLSRSLDILLLQSENFPEVLPDGGIANRVRELKISRELGKIAVALCDSSAQVTEERERHYLRPLLEDLFWGGVPTDRMIISPKPVPGFVDNGMIERRRPQLAAFNDFARSHRDALAAPPWQPVRLLWTSDACAFSREAHIGLAAAEEICLRNQVPFGYAVASGHGPFAIPDDCEVLVVANQVCLSDAQVAVLAEYAKRGGRLVVTGDSGRYDEWNAQRLEDPLLLRIAGLPNVVLRAEPDRLPSASLGWENRVSPPTDGGAALMTDIAATGWNAPVRVAGAPSRVFAEFKRTGNGYALFLLNYDPDTPAEDISVVGPKGGNVRFEAVCDGSGAATLRAGPDGAVRLPSFKCGAFVEWNDTNIN